MNGTPRMASRISSHARFERRAAGDQQQRIEIALHGDAARVGQRAICRSGIAVSQPIPSTPVSPHVALGVARRRRAEIR